MTRVFVASPYAGDVDANVAYAKRCLRDSLDRGEAPIAPHLMHPGVLDDSVPLERAAGLNAGKAWLAQAELLAVYTDRGVSSGMAGEIAEAECLEIPIERRSIDVAQPPLDSD